MRGAAPTVVFDLDGTLTDSGLGIVRSTRLALERLNGSGAAAAPVPAEAELGWIIGPPLIESFAALVGAERAPILLAYFRERYATVGMFESSLYDGVVDALERLTGDGYRLFVATSKPEPFARRILDHFALTRYFTQIYGSEMDGRRAAKSELLAYLIGRERLDASRRIVMIGDRRHDALGARAVGVPTIGALWGYGSADELAEAGADPLIDHPRQIPDAVASVFARAR